MARPSTSYEPRDPAGSVLHRIVQDHFETFLACASHLRDGDGVPAFVERAFRHFLRCGLLAGGFARFHCGECGLDRLAWDHDLCRRVTAVFLRAFFRLLRDHARAVGLEHPRGGAVAIIQRFGGALNLNVHIHALVLDGVFAPDGAGAVAFHPARRLTTLAVATPDGCGLAAVMPMTAMVAKTVGSGGAVPGLDLTVPQDDSACAAVLDINSLAYGMDLEAGKPVLGSRAFWKDQFAVVGVADGKAVSSAAVLMVDGHRYVALVATDPGQQRRGFADATMRRALENAAGVHGDRPTVLHATDAGRPIYERMGYTSIATHSLFMEKRFFEEH